jgi:uncharacterized protein
MVLVHFNGRAPSASGLGGTFQRLIELFVETRAYTVFAILFGVGFAIQLRRSEARGDSISVRFIRRLVALLCFGLVAEFGFGYHVLVGYALMGFPLLLVRNWSTRALLVAAFFCVAITGLYRISLYSYRTMTVGIESAQAAATRTQTSYTEDFQAFVKAGQSSTFAERLPPGLAWGFGVMLDRSSSCRVAISRASSSA